MKGLKKQVYSQVEALPSSLPEGVFKDYYNLRLFSVNCVWGQNGF